MWYKRINAKEAKANMEEHIKTEKNVAVLYEMIIEASKNGKESLRINEGTELFRTVDLHRKEFEFDGFIVDIYSDSANIRWVPYSGTEQAPVIEEK